jgi:hypothetical protein
MEISSVRPQPGPLVILGDDFHPGRKRIKDVLCILGRFAGEFDFQGLRGSII